MPRNSLLRLFSVGLLFALLSAAPVEGFPAQPERITAPRGNGHAAIARNLRLPAATWLNDRDGDKVFDSLEARYADSPGATQYVVVTLAYGTEVTEALAQAREVAGSFAPTHVFHHFGGFVAHLRLDQALRIGSLDAVRQIEWAATPGRPAMETAAVNGGARTIQTALDVDGDGDADPITGKGVTIAILDTGFDGQHVDLEGAFLTFRDETAGGVVREPYDPDGHGTHVASIAAGRGVGDPALRGVAPGADLVGFRIDEPCPDTEFLLQPVLGECGPRANTLSAVDWMLANGDQYGIRIMSISYVLGPASPDGTDSLELAMDRLWEAGIIPFAAAGNHGAERGRIFIPSTARGAIAVGMMSDAQIMNHREFAPHLNMSSSRGPTPDGRIKPDLAAYGVSIRAADAGTVDGYVEFSGTSMATPYAAGVAALMLEANPSLTPAEVREILFETAEDWGAPGADVDYGHGLVQPVDAVQRALGGGTAIPPAQPDHETAQMSVDGPSMGAVRLAIDVMDASGPLAITVIVRGRSMQPVPDNLPSVGPSDKRAFDIVLLAPGESPNPVPSPDLDTASRQMNYNVSRPVAGRYILHVRNLGRADVLDVDVVGADVNVTPL